MTKSRKLPGRPVRTTLADIKRLQDVSASVFGGKTVSDDGARAAAAALAAIRTLQRELGPGHAPFELIASAVPHEYKKNWAKSHLGLVERR